MEPKRGARNGILSLAIKDKAVLYAAFMPFVRNGGLFIPTKKEYDLGDLLSKILSDNNDIDYTTYQLYLISLIVIRIQG